MNDDFYFDIKRERPEEKYPSVFEYFQKGKLAKYANSKSMMKIQESITIRALELLGLKERSLVLDLGCGPGFSSIYLKEIGYATVALDIISEFLKFYDIKELNPLQSDMSYMPFKPATFDAIISISALQWIFRDMNNLQMRNNMISLAKRIEIILKPNSNAVFQFYPKNDLIMKEIGKIFADNTALEGNFIIDNPNSPKKRKIFLFLKN